MPLFRRSKSEDVEDKPKRKLGRFHSAIGRLEEVKERARPRADQGKKFIRNEARTYARGVQGSFKRKKRRKK